MPGRLLPPEEGSAKSCKVKEASPRQPLYEVVDIPNKGRGLRAKVTIPKGTKILAEKTLLVLKFSQHASNDDGIEAIMARQLEDMSLDEQSAVINMHNAFLDQIPELAGILKTNAFVLDDEGLGLFREACLINHSCGANVEAAWDGDARCMVLHAIRDIAANEELTQDYLHTLDGYNERQDELWNNYGFRCDCSVCSLPESERHVSDERRAKIQRLEEMIACELFREPACCLRAVKLMIELLKEEDLGGSHEGKAYYYASQITLAHGDEARASVFAERCYQRMRLFKGETHPETVKALMMVTNPKCHKLYGDSFLWQSATGDKPQDLQEKELEVWLWSPEESGAER